MSRENPVPICISRDASMERLLAGRYFGKEKEQAVTGGLGPSGLR